MNRNIYRRLSSLGCLSVVASTAYLLGSGEEWLGKIPFPDWPIPYGNLFTWFGLVAWLLLPVLWTPRQLQTRTFRVIHYAMFAAAALWPFVGYFLAANWSLNFGYSESFRGSSEAGEYAFIYTAVLALFPIISAIGLILYWAYTRLIARFHGSR